jgi:hypothetical protein
MAYKEHFDKLKKEKIELAKADDEVLAELQKIERVTHTHHRTRTIAHAPSHTHHRTRTTAHAPPHTHHRTRTIAPSHTHTRS